MQIMCYEQLLKVLFKSKQNQQQNCKSNDRKIIENQKQSKQFLKLQMNPFYDHFRKYVESDESCSSSNTYVETLESDPNTIYSCQHYPVIYKSVCNNSLHYTDFKNFHKRYPEYLTPQQISKTTKITLPPHVHRASSHRRVANEDNLSIFNNRNILNFKESSTIEIGRKKPKSKSDFSYHSYHLTKTIHSPPPNRNPFDLSEAHF